MVKAAVKKRNYANRVTRKPASDRISIEDDKLYFVSDLVQILKVHRQTIVRYKRDKGLPLSGVSRGSILGCDLKRWLQTVKA